MGKTRSKTKRAEILRQMYLWVEEKRARILPAGKISREAMRSKISELQSTRTPCQEFFFLEDPQF